MLKSIVKQIKSTSGIDRLMFLAVTIEPLVTMPQLIQILRDKNATGVSITSWVGYDLLTVIWLLYAKKQKDKMIILYSLLSLVLQTAIIFAALKYGGKWS